MGQNRNELRAYLLARNEKVQERVIESIRLMESPKRVNMPKKNQESLAEDEPRKTGRVSKKREQAPAENVRSQKHYTGNDVELIDVVAGIPAWKMNAMKYIFRAGEKGDYDKFFQDLEKAEVYIEYGRRS